MPATAETASLYAEDMASTMASHVRTLDAHEARALCQPLFDLGMSPAKLARELGISKALVSRWLDGSRPMTTEQTSRVLALLLTASSLRQPDPVQPYIAAWLDARKDRRKALYRLSALLARTLDAHYTRAAEGTPLSPEMKTALDDICAELDTGRHQFKRLDNLIALGEAYPMLVKQVRETRATQAAQGKPFHFALKVEGETVEIDTGDIKAGATF
jgi:predicted transcriptional regulator